MLNRVTFLLLTITIAILTSCFQREATVDRRFVIANEGKTLDDTFEQIVVSINNQDEDALKSLFSARALADNTNFDEQMDRLFGFVEGEIESWERSGGPATTEERDSKTGLNWEGMQATYDIVTDKQVYHASLLEITRHTHNSDIIGVSSFCVISANDWKEDYNYWGDLGRTEDFKTLGIFIDTTRSNNSQD